MLTNAAPVLTTANVAMTESADRPIAIATTSPGPIPRLISSRAIWLVWVSNNDRSTRPAPEIAMGERSGRFSMSVTISRKVHGSAPGRPRVSSPTRSAATRSTVPTVICGWDTNASRTRRNWSANASIVSGSKSSRA